MDPADEFETLTDGWGKAVRLKKVKGHAHAETKPRLVPTATVRRAPRPDVRIGKCPTCGRRYGFVPTPQDRIDPNAEQYALIPRACDAHAR